MAVAIRMPDLGTTVDECRVMGWRVREGDPVALGDILADIETDKAIVELESVAAGVLLKLVADEEAIVQVGDVLAYVGQPGEAIPAEAAPAASAEAARPVAVPAETSPATRLAAVAPVVRNLAAKLGVDLSAVQGTGQGGIITREDVQRAARAASGAPAPIAEGPARSRRQAAVARAVAASWAEKPHAYFTAALDMSAAQQLRERYAAQGNPVSYDALLLRAMAQALPEFPPLRSVWREGRVVTVEGIHLALAVSREDELFLPVIRDVDRLSLVALQADVNEVVAQVRANALPASRLTGACLALSNLGMYPLESFQPIIFPEHSAILAVGTAQPTPVVVEGRVEVRPIMRVTLAVDHRLVNGRTAAEFLAAVKAGLETGG
jgi:pyruvate dehydrogenase E2 component (dihydrolipoamide acetyltransferase)